MCKELYKHKEHLWTFRSDPEVEPTNNAGERSLRHGVIWRKLSFGTQSERGDRFVETLLTSIETCQKQGRSVVQFVTPALRPTNTTNTNHPLGSRWQSNGSRAAGAGRSDSGSDSQRSFF